MLFRGFIANVLIRWSKAFFPIQTKQSNQQQLAHPAPGWVWEGIKLRRICHSNFRGDGPVKI
jgi:hypothetical protein